MTCRIRRWGSERTESLQKKQNFWDFWKDPFHSSLDQTLEHPLELSGVYVKTQKHPRRILDSVGLWSSQRSCISKFSGDADTASLGPQFVNHWLWVSLLLLSFTTNSSFSQHHQDNCLIAYLKKLFNLNLDNIRGRKIFVYYIGKNPVNSVFYFVNQIDLEVDFPSISNSIDPSITF